MQIETTKGAIKARVLEARTIAAKSSKVDQFKLAVCRFIMDAAGVCVEPGMKKEDIEKTNAKRLAIWKQFNATSGSFGSNLSGYEQDNDLRVAKDKLEDYTGAV